ncbi:hypothetical protein GW17_00031600, partial [Ensete ventricosum]
PPRERELSRLLFRCTPVPNKTLSPLPPAAGGSAPIHISMKREGEVVRVGKYEVGRTLGEGNFAKVKLARHVDSGRCFAVKVLERKRVLDLHTHDQIKREIGTLKLLKHPNVVRLYEVCTTLFFFFFPMSRSGFRESQGMRL